MASFILSTAISEARVISGGQVGVILSTGGIMTDGVSAVWVTSGGRLTVAGALTANGTNAYGATFYNAGSVPGDGYMTVASTGVVFGEIGVSMNAIASNYFVNNAGMIGGQFTGVNITCQNVQLYNSDQITGFGSTAVYLNISGTYNVSNSGEMNGPYYGFFQNGSGGGHFVNTGHIFGSVQSLHFGDGIDTVINFGTLSGDVSLGAGADVFNGYGGQQTVIGGGLGNDTITGGALSEVIDGGGNDDLLRGNGGDDSLFGADGLDSMLGGLGDDVMYGQSGADTMAGGDGDDYMDGGSEADQVRGGNGDDTLDGGAGLDFLYGGAGDDSLQGGTLTDRLYGGVGDDTMDGGSGADFFIFARGNGADLVVNFLDNVDKLNLRAFDIPNLSALISHASDSAAGLVLDLSSWSGGSITLAGFTLAQLSAADVLL